jgi:hypothetical protein
MGQGRAGVKTAGGGKPDAFACGWRDRLHPRDVKHILHGTSGSEFMKQELIAQLHASFEQLVQVEEETKVEFWLARDLQRVVGYETWRRFEQVVQKAITACRNAGYDPKDHFAEVGKMIPLGKGGEKRDAE